GYQAIADLTAPLMERDHYGATPAAAVTAPNLQRAYFTTSSRNEIALEFDQNMFWNNSATSNFYLDRVGGQVSSGSATGKVVTLQLNGPTTGRTLDYVVDQYWNGSATNLLTGTNAISALTFYAVPITLPPPTTDPYAIWIASKQLSGADAAVTADPDHDGISNGMEFVLGGQPNPANPDSNSRGLLPVVFRNPDGSMAFTFHRKTVSTSAALLTFQWSTDLRFPPSNDVPVGAVSSATNGVTVDVTGNSPDAATDLIVITVPANKIVDGKLFGRLGVAVQSTVPSTTAYDTWIATTLLSGADAAAAADPDQDGLPNMMEFVLGGQPNPARPGSNSRGLLPTIAQSAGNLVFTYRRSAVSLTQPGLSISAEYASDLSTWTPAQNNVNGVTIVTTPDGFEAGIDKVEVFIPQALATGTRFFVHLKVTEP
ncbi:MAG: hypothetical protein WCP45_04060, partial [Verrucomicrobiota bacterium]